MLIKRILLIFFKFIYHLPITISCGACNDIKQDQFPLYYALHIRSQPPVTKLFQTLYWGISCIFIGHCLYFHSSSILLNVSSTLSSLNFYYKVLNMLLKLLSIHSHQLKKQVSNQSPCSTDRMDIVQYAKLDSIFNYHLLQLLFTCLVKIENFYIL